MHSNDEMKLEKEGEKLSYPKEIKKKMHSEDRLFIAGNVGIIFTNLHQVRAKEDKKSKKLSRQFSLFLKIQELLLFLCIEEIKFFYGKPGHSLCCDVFGGRGIVESSKGLIESLLMLGPL